MTELIVCKTITVNKEDSWLEHNSSLSEEPEIYFV